GRKITFVTYDDGYDPATTVSNVRRLVEQDRVFITAGIFGTPGTAAVLPYLTQQNVPLFFPVTSYSAFDAPQAYPLLVMAGPGYARTAEVVGRYWHDVFPGERIGLLTQATEPGPNFVRGLATGLGSASKHVVGAETAPTVAAL